MKLERNTEIQQKKRFYISRFDFENWNMEIAVTVLKGTPVQT